MPALSFDLILPGLIGGPATHPVPSLFRRGVFVQVAIGDDAEDDKDHYADNDEAWRQAGHMTDALDEL